MAKDYKLIRRAFNAGELSKRAKWRNDFEKHSMACEELENFYVSPLGDVSRRKGTRLIKDLTTYWGDNNSDKEKVRILPFEYNAENSYILAFHCKEATAQFYEYKVSDLVLPASWSLRIPLPMDMADEITVLELGNLKLKRTKWDDSNNRIFYFSIGDTDYEHETYVNGDYTSLLLTLKDGKFTARYVCDDGNTSIVEVSADGFSMEENSSLLYRASSKINLVEDDNRIRFIAHSPIGLDANSEYNLRAINRIRYSGDDSGVFFGLNDIGYIDFDNYDESLCNSQIKLKGDTCSFASGVKWDNSYNEALLSFSDAVGDFEDLSENTPEDFKAFVEIFAKALGFTEADALNFEDYEDYLLGLQSNDKMDFASPYLALLVKHYLHTEIESDSGVRVAVGEMVLNLKFWKNFITEQIYPLAYDALFVPFYIPVGCTPAFNNSGEVKIYAYDKNGKEQKLDGTHTEDIETLVFIGEIARPVGEATLTETNSIAGTQYLQDKVDAGVWATDNPVMLSMFDVEGNTICRNITLPILPNALDEFQFKQVGGWVYLAHDSFAPTRLKFNGTTFDVENAGKFYPSEDKPAYLKNGLKAQIMLKGGDSDGISFAGEKVDLVSQGFFKNSMVGTQLKIDYTDDISHTYKWKYSPAFVGYISKSYAVLGEVKVILEGGIWDGVLLLEESTDNGKTWHEIARTSSIQGSTNEAIAREIFDPNTIVRVRMLEMNQVISTDTSKVETHQEGCFFQITTNATNSVWCNVVEVKSKDQARVELLNPCRNKFTSSEVYLASWSEDFGYPRTVDIHEERLTFAGNREHPSMIWLSQTNNWDNFRSVSKIETDPLAYNLACDSGEPICWIVSREDLMIGLGNAEWSLGSRDNGQALTQSIVKASEQSNDGVEYISPAKVGNLLVYVRRGNCEIGSITYDFAMDSYNSVSLTTINPEILGNGVKCIFNQLSPRNNLFALRKDGTLAVFTYDKENNVMAWSRFTFGEGVASACAVSTGSFRSVFIVVKRQNRFLLERLDANESATDNWLDCVPINNTIEIASGLNTGVKYTSRIKTTPIFLKGHIKIFGIQFFAMSALGGRYRVVGFGSDGEFKQDQWRDFLLQESEVFNDKRLPRDWRYKGEVDIGYLEEASIEIECDTQSGFNLCALAIKAEG